MQSRALCVVTLSLGVAIAGCTKSTAPGTNSANTNAAVPVTESVGAPTLPPATTIEIPDRFTTTLDGTIGALPVRVRLSRNKDQMSGEYVYETARPAIRTVVQLLSLDGTIDSTGAVRLSESASDGDNESKTSGAFDGTLTNTTLGMRFVGTWKKPDGTSSMPVVLNALASTPSGMRFVSTPMPSADRRLASVVTVVYPRAEGGDTAKAAAFSNALEGFVRERVRQYSADALESLNDEVTVDMMALEIDYEIAVATDDVVSIVFTEYTSFGGAHPSSSVYARNYEFARGRFLTLTDVTGDTRGLLAMLSQKCKAILPKDEVFQVDVDPTAENFSEWYVTRRGMSFVFSLPYVAGNTMQAYLPFSEIKGALNADGPLGSLIR